MREIDAHHSRCGTDTRVRLPAVLPARVVRRVHCQRCDERFDADRVSQAGGFSLSRVRESVSLPHFDPSNRGWQIASVPVAAALVVGGLLLIQGGDDEIEPGEPRPSAARADEQPPPLEELPGKSATTGGAEEDAAAEIVRGSHYSLALPAGWAKVDPPSGATFAAAATEGQADATLWIEENPKLSFPAFITQSLQQLETLAPNPTVCDRVSGPTPETTLVRLCAESPSDQPGYEVLLRAAGRSRYYLALTIQPDADGDAIDGADLIAGSLTPEVAG